MTTETLMRLSPCPPDEELLVYSDSLEEAGEQALAELVRALPGLIAQIEAVREGLRKAFVEPTCLRLRPTGWSWHQYLARPGHPAPGNARHGRKGPQWSYPHPVATGNMRDSRDVNLDALHDSHNCQLVEALVRRLGLDHYELHRTADGPYRSWHLIDLCRDPKRPVEATHAH